MESNFVRASSKTNLRVTQVFLTNWFKPNSVSDYKCLFLFALEQFSNILQLIIEKFFL